MPEKEVSNMPKTLSRKQPKTKKAPRPSRRTRAAEAPPETVAIDLEVIYDVLDVLDNEIRQTEGPWANSRGEIGWWDNDWRDIRAFMLDIETQLKAVLKKREIDQAVAKELAARGITSGTVAAVLEFDKSGAVGLRVAGKGGAR
jgi:hypothetical protein